MGERPGGETSGGSLTYVLQTRKPFMPLTITTLVIIVIPSRRNTRLNSFLAALAFTQGTKTEQPGWNDFQLIVYDIVSISIGGWLQIVIHAKEILAARIKLQRTDSW